MFIGFEAPGFAAIGEAPEDRWVLSGAAEMSVDWGVVIYAATHEMITRPGDTPPDQMFKGTLEKAFRIDRSIVDSNSLGERITIGLGEVTLSNLEQDYDFLSIDHTPQGQAIVIKMGERDKPYEEWRTVLSGYMIDHVINRDKVTFRMRDAGHVLDVPLSPNLYAGTGGVDGTEDVKDKRKPRAFGWCLNAQPPLVIPSSLAYQLNDGPIQEVQNVYVRGVAQAFTADYASVASMNAATLTVGQYATCLAEGWMRIGAASDTELGEVTCDFAGDAAGEVFVETTGDIVRRMLGATTLTDPDDLVASSFDTLNSAQPAPVGYFSPAGSDETVAQAVANLMAGIGGWCGAKRTGKFAVARLEAPAGHPSGVYDRTNVVDVETIPMPEELSPPPWRIKVGYGRNWTPGQTDLAGSVSETRRAFLAEEVRLASASSLRVRADFPPGHEWVKTGTYFRDEADALAEAERLGELFWTPRALYVFPLNQKLFVHELGQCVDLSFPRFDLTNGKRLRIVRLEEDDVDGVKITAFG